MSQPTQAGFGSTDRPPIELPHPVRMRVLGAVMIGVFLAALDQTVVGTALPTDHHRPRRQRPLHVGVHRLPADLDHQRTALRQAVRPVRPAADLPVRDRHLHGRLAASPACRRRCGSSSRRGASRASVPERCSRSRSRSSATCSRRPSAAGTRACSAPCSGCPCSIGPAIGGVITDTIGWPFVFFFNLPVGAAVFVVRLAQPAAVPPRPATGRRSTTSARPCSRRRSCRSSSG